MCSVLEPPFDWHNDAKSPAQQTVDQRTPYGVFKLFGKCAVAGGKPFPYKLDAAATPLVICASPAAAHSHLLHQAQLRMTRAAQLSVPSIAWALNRSGPPWQGGA